MTMTRSAGDPDRSGDDARHPHRSPSARRAPSAHRAPHPRGARAAAAGALLAILLSSCLPGASSPEETTAAPAPTMDPSQVAAAELTAVNTSWLCEAGDDGQPEHSGSPGVVVPREISADGDQVQVTGTLDLEDGYEATGFAPDALVTPAHAENRALPADPFAGTAGAEDYPLPPIVAIERVETELTGEPPATVSARLRLGTCDGAALPDGPYLLSLAGGGIESPRRGENPAGWLASADVLLDVVDGQVRPVPGALTAPSGEIPVDMSGLACGTALTATDADAASLAISVQTPPTSLPAAPADEGPVMLSADVTVTAPTPGTRGLLEGIVITNPTTGTIVAGARHADVIGLGWIPEEGITSTVSTPTTQGTCSRRPLAAGAYQAHGFALSVGADGGTELSLSDPWALEITAPADES